MLQREKREKSTEERVDGIFAREDAAARTGRRVFRR